MARILIVEDVEDIRVAFQMLLETAGHDVVQAINGTQAMSILKEMDFDLVVTDLIMPDGDGFELATYMHSMEKMPKTIMISGGGDRLSLPQALDMARNMFDAVLSKPVTGVELMDTVEAVLSKG